MFEAEGTPHRIDLVHEAFHFPERGIVEPVRTAATELVAVDDRAVLRERFEGLQIIVARSRPAVQGQERYCAFTDAAVPDPVAIYLDSAFFAFQAGFSPLPTFPNRSFGPAVYIKRTGMESCIRGSDRGGV